MTASEIAAALRCDKPRCKCGRKSGASWTAHCPAHEDRSPSLSVSAGKDGRAVAHCHAGCSQDAVIAAFMARGLWPSAPSRPGRTRETRYDVRDTDGALIAVHIRTDKPDGPKAMHWERPDGSKGLDGLPTRELPLYLSERLPVLPDGARVVLTEGERAADALTARGIAAVGTVTGAASTPGDDALRPLARLSVALWPDNDGPGGEHMARIGDALARIGCADVRIVDWPDAPDKGDAADFGGTGAELAALLDAAQPWDTTPTLDGAEVLGDVRAFIRRYVATGDAEADTLTLWTAHTHASEGAEATPYINLTSAEKRSGKTRTLEALALLTASPWLTSRTSPAVLVRKLDRDGPTLLLDETDAAFKDGGDYAEALRAVLNAGHRRGGVASLCVKAGGDFELRDFAVFGPKVFAGIGQHLPETVRDRSVTIELRRRAPTETVERFRRREAETVAAPIREALAHWTAAHLEALRSSRPEIPDALDDRAADGWEPLLAIADAASGDWPTRARRAALILSVGEGREDDSLGVRLLRDVRAVFDKREAERLSSTEIVAALVADESAPWGDLRGKPMDARALARILRRYGLKPHLMRMEGSDTPGRGYRRTDFEDAFSRYLEMTVTSVTTVTPDRNDVTAVTAVTVNPGMCAPDACTLCGSLDIDGYTLDGSPRCSAHYLREPDGALVRVAVEGTGARIVARTRWKLLPGDDITDPAPPSANGKRRCPCGLGLSVVAVGDKCGRCAARDNAGLSVVRGAK